MRRAGLVGISAGRQRTMALDITTRGQTSNVCLWRSPGIQMVADQPREHGYWI
jgi:hypothetical protein